jgi:proteasome lid subunit RPN8/RPN11
MRLLISRADFDAIAVHAKSWLPYEACGLIAGRAEGDTRVVTAVYPTANADRSREHFTIEPREQLAAIKDMRARGLSPLGNFHSHPETPARPSPEDVRLARDPNAAYLILSLAGEEPVLRAFRVENGAADALTLEITDNPN